MEFKRRKERARMMLENRALAFICLLLAVTLLMSLSVSWKSVVEKTTLFTAVVPKWIVTSNNVRNAALVPLHSKALSSRESKLSNQDDALVINGSDVWGKDVLPLFIHIPKCSGGSLIHEGKKLWGLNWWPKVQQGLEYCFRNTYEGASENTKSRFLVMFRSPREHFKSQYNECRNDKWGVRTTNGTAFPRNQTALKDFIIWVKHFQQPTTDFYNCYHPTNMQSRYLACNTHNAHKVQVDMLVPNKTVVRNNLKLLSFIGLTDFFPESVCLLHYKLNGTMPDNCFCESQSMLKVPHVVHHKTGDNVAVKDLNSTFLKIVDELTSMDQWLFVAALRIFFQQIRSIEHVLKARVICPQRLAVLQPRLEYVVHNLTQVYEESFSHAATKQRKRN